MKLQLITPPERPLRLREVRELSYGRGCLSCSCFVNAYAHGCILGGDEQIPKNKRCTLFICDSFELDVQAALTKEMMEPLPEWPEGVSICDECMHNVTKLCTDRPWSRSCCPKFRVDPHLMKDGTATEFE